MSIASEITRINNNIAATYTALSAKGATLPATENSANLASTVATVPSGGGGDPANKAFGVDNGVLGKPKNITFSANTFDGVTSVSDYGLYYTYYTPYAVRATAPTGPLSFPDLVSIGSYGIDCGFENSNLTSISFPKLTSVDSYGLRGAFRSYSWGSVSPFAVSFPLLNSVSTRSLEEAFAHNKISEVTCAVLTSVSDSSFKNTFYQCEFLQTASFQELLTTVRQSFYSCFNGCTTLNSVSFPKLNSIGDQSFKIAFNNCTSLTTISFPSLAAVDSYGLEQAFSGCTNLTSIHFPASMQSAIEAMSGYSSKWGASNATIYFDL